MRSRTKSRRIDIEKLWSKLRRLQVEPADVVVVVSLRLNEHGGFDTDVNVAHWLEFPPGEEPAPNCLPIGVADHLAKLFAHQAALSRGGELFATLGASFGKAALETGARMFRNMRNKDG